MTILNGRVGKRFTSDRECMFEFIDGITRAEWGMLGQFTPIARYTQLVDIVVKLRKAKE